jgi:UDP-sugar transporter A1/2/3
MVLQYFALVSLILQNSGQAIMMRYTFIIATEHHERYISSTAVLLAEVFKFFISLVACYFLDSDKSFRNLSQLLYHEFVVNRTDLFKLMIPSILYTVQNSLQYFSMQCLSAPVFQVLYQMKIITTAMFSVLLLSKDLSSIQWISILFLTIGVALVQLSQTDSSSSSHGSHGSSGSNSNNHSGTLLLTNNSIAGLVSVLCGCLTSGFAGVYFEKVLKSSKASLWLRNIQLSFIGIVMSLISCRLRDSLEIHDRGFFAGYNPWVWSVILLQTIGGIVRRATQLTSPYYSIIICFSCSSSSSFFLSFS